MNKLFSECNNLLLECSEYQDIEFDSIDVFEKKLLDKRGILFLYDKNNLQQKDDLIKKIRRNYEIIEILDNYTCIFLNQNDEKKYNKYIQNQYFFEFQPSIFVIEKNNNKYKSTKIDFNYNKFCESIKKLNLIKFKSKILLPNSGVILDEQYQGIYNYNDNAEKETKIEQNDIKDSYNLFQNNDSYMNQNNNLINLNENNLKYSNQNINLINKNKNNNSIISKSNYYSINNNFSNNNNNYPNNNINDINQLKEIDGLICESIIEEINNNNNNNNNNNYNIEPEKEKPKFKIDPKKVEEAKKRLPPERNEDDLDITLVIYRFPKSSTRENRIFSKYDKIGSMFDYVISLGDKVFNELNQEEFILTQPFPRKIIDYDKNLTFEQSGLIDEVIVDIEPKK